LAVPKDEWRKAKPVYRGYESQFRNDRQASAMASRWLRAHGHTTPKAKRRRRRRERKERVACLPPDTRPARVRAAELEQAHLLALAAVEDARRSKAAIEQLARIGVLPPRSRELRAARARLRDTGRRLRAVQAEWEAARNQAAAEEARRAAEPTTAVQ
jgi:hypothetical protein